MPPASGNTATSAQVQAVANQITSLSAKVQLVANQVTLLQNDVTTVIAKADLLAAEVKTLGDQGAAAVRELTIEIERLSDLIDAL